MLLGEDCKQELQRKYEKIMLDEHITNLYAPRIIAQKTTAEVESTKTLSFGDTRKSFKHGVRSSNWANFKKRALEDPRYSERTQLSNLLDSRRERTHLMNNKVLEGWGEEEADMGNGVAGGETASLGRLRSKSMSRGLPKKASRNAGIIKAHYDAVQQRKKNTSRQASLRSGNLAMTVEEEEEKEEEEQEEVKRRHFTMPESVV